MSDEPCTIVNFGASGDLTVRKLIPALYHLFHEGQMSESFHWWVLPATYFDGNAYIVMSATGWPITD